MSYWILLASGIPFLKKTVQRVTYIETWNDAIKQRFKLNDKAIKDSFHEKYNEEAFAVPNSTKPTMEMWAELAEDDEDLQSSSASLTAGLSNTLLN